MLITTMTKQRTTYLVVQHCSWTSNKDTKQSTSGYLFSLGSTPITRLSKRQSSVALSTCEVEHIGSIISCRGGCLATVPSLSNIQLTENDYFLKHIIRDGDSQRADTVAKKNHQCHARATRIDIQESKLLSARFSRLQPMVL